MMPLVCSFLWLLFQNHWANASIDSVLVRHPSVSLLAFEKALTDDFSVVSPQRKIALDLEKLPPDPAASQLVDEALAELIHHPQISKLKFEQSIQLLESTPLSRETRIFMKSVLSKMLELELSNSERLLTGQRLVQIEKSLKPEVDTLFRTPSQSDGLLKLSRLADKLRKQLGWEDLEIFVDGEKSNFFTSLDPFDHHQWIFLSSARTPVLIVGPFAKVEKMLEAETPFWVLGSCERPKWFTEARRNFSAVLSDEGCVKKFESFALDLPLQSSQLESSFAEPKKSRWPVILTVGATILLAGLLMQGKEMVIQNP